MLEITIPGKPVPWARARQSGQRFYTPKKQAAHRKTLVSWIQGAVIMKPRMMPLKGPVAIDLEFDYEAEHTLIRVWSLSSGFRAARPDLDNLIKQVAEALQDSGLLSDDAQIASIQAKKVN